MNWRTKAFIQRACATLPFGGEALYYQLQRRFGNLRHPESPLGMIRHAASIFDELHGLGLDLHSARVVEIGAGHRLNMPIAFYLAGAASILTVDLYRVLKPALVLASLRDLAASRDQIAALFPGSERRIEKLCACDSFSQVIQTLNLEYRAPCDATATGLAPASFDLHFSYTVFEHISGTVLVEILREASRLIAPGGLICHHIDLSDHFSHSDPSIKNINFLRYSFEEWKRIDNPRFGYQNRLREPDYRALFTEGGQDIVKWVKVVDWESVNVLQHSFPLATAYRGIDAEVLATVSVRAFSRPLTTMTRPYEGCLAV